MTGQLVFLPILVPLATGIILLFLYRNVPWQRLLSFASTLLVFGLSAYLLYTVWTEGIVVYRFGDWLAPFGIVLVADTLSGVFLLATMSVALATVVFSFSTIDAQRERFFYYPLIQFLLVGVNGSLLTGDLFNLFVLFEIMLIASYALLSLGGTKEQLEATLKYISINLFSSTFLLINTGLLYGLVGTLNMAHLSARIQEAPDKGVLTVLAVMFTVVFSIKSAVFLFHFWLPGAYTVIPAPAATLFSVLTKVGIYAMLRVLTVVFAFESPVLQNVLLALGALSMLLGVLGAAAQNNIRSILTWHIVSQIGYMVMGIGIYTTLSIAGTIYFTIHNVIVKSSLFFFAGVVERITGTGELKRLGGLAGPYSALGFLFMFAGLSLAGFPPLSGFFGKLVLIQAGLEEGRFVVVGVALVVSLLTLYSMMKIWQGVFWGEGAVVERPAAGVLSLPLAYLVLLSLWLGLLAEPALQVSLRAAGELLDPSAYISAVLGEV